MRKLCIAAALAGAAFVSAVQGGWAQASPAEVRIENFTFKPATMSVRAGTVVTFTNADDIPHSIVAADGTFHSKALDTGDAFSFTFSKPGEVTYFCGLHPKMEGHIVVMAP